MKKRNLLCVLGAVAALSLASCGKTATPTPTPTPTPTEEKQDDANALVATFDESINTTVKLTYNVSFDVDVVREGNDATNFDSFKHKTRSTTVVEMDLGEDLYIKVTKTTKDLLVSEEETKLEELLYKKDGVYYYATKSTPAVKVASADARAKVNDILASVSYELVGSISVDTLLYNKTDKSYELAEFGLTETFLAEELVDPEYSVNANGGLHVVYKPEYVGYKTDGGWSDFPAASGKDSAAVITIDTNNKGYVTNWKETYNAALVFNIMSNPPLVTIGGERSFTAEYGVTLTKADSVAMTPSVAVYEQAEGGTFVVKTCAMGAFNQMTEVANGGTLEMGKFICVKVTPAEGKEVASVSVNGKTETVVEPKDAGGFYCFNVAVGDNEIVVTYKDAPKKDAGTVEIPALATAKVEVFTCAPYGFAAMQPVANGGEVVPGNWICVKVTPAGENTVTSVKHNGSDVLLADLETAKGFYCFTAVEGKNKLEVAITGEAVLKAKVNVTNESNIAYKLQSFVYGETGPSNYQDITNGEIVPGAAIFGAIVVAANTPVVVTVNGVATTVNIPVPNATNPEIIYYCFSVKTADTFNVVITPATAE